MPIFFHLYAFLTLVYKTIGSLKNSGYCVLLTSPATDRLLQDTPTTWTRIHIIFYSVLVSKGF